MSLLNEIITLTFIYKSEPSLSVGEGTHRHGKFFLTFLNVSFTLKLDSSPLGEVAGSLGFGEPLLNLVINKLDKGIILKYSKVKSRYHEIFPSSTN